MQSVENTKATRAFHRLRRVGSPATLPEVGDMFRCVFHSVFLWSKSSIRACVWVAKRFRKSTRKFTQVTKFVMWPNAPNLALTCVVDYNASGWPNELATQVEGKSRTLVDLRRLASPFGQGFNTISNMSDCAMVLDYLICVPDFS